MTTTIGDCPQWEQPEPFGNLPPVARGMEDVYSFIRKANAKKYLLNHGDIRSWHLKLFSAIVPVHYYAGNYRSDDPRHPCLNIDVQVGGRPGAPYRLVPEMMRQFSGKMSDNTVATDGFVARSRGDIERSKAAIQLAAVCAGRLIQIHPFINGNGRVARLLMCFFLNRYGLKMPFFALGRPPLDYPSASAACMIGDFIPLFKYLVTLLAK